MDVEMEVLLYISVALRQITLVEHEGLSSDEAGTEAFERERE
jgi:hypothetical protein